MRTTLALDDELIAKAQAFTGVKEKSALVREALKALIERESARRLARLGGTQRAVVAAPVRRHDARSPMVDRARPPQRLPKGSCKSRRDFPREVANPARDFPSDTARGEAPS